MLKDWIRMAILELIVKSEVNVSDRFTMKEIAETQGYDLHRMVDKICGCGETEFVLGGEGDNTIRLQSKQKPGTAQVGDEEEQRRMEFREGRMDIILSVGHGRKKYMGTCIDMKDGMVTRWCSGGPGDPMQENLYCPDTPVEYRESRYDEDYYDRMYESMAGEDEEEECRGCSNYESGSETCDMCREMSA